MPGMDIADLILCAILALHPFCKRTHRIITIFLLAFFAGGHLVPDAAGHLVSKQILFHAGCAPHVVVDRIQGTVMVCTGAEISDVFHNE